MRLFYFLLLIPVLTNAAPPTCDESDLIAGSGGCTSLTIDNAMNLTGAGGAPLEITVNGDVNITADIIIDGANGVPLSADNTPGVSGGPGATGGGGISGATAEPGTGFSPADGTNGASEPACGSGGGAGAGPTVNGGNGLLCPGGTLTGAGGTAPGFPAPFSGGFGGGAGGEKDLGGAVFDLGGGGGGGGGLHIDATGTITIANGVNILARGGRGGNSVNIGGAGGGGSGGNVFLVSALAIINQGIIDVSGGAGGTTTLGGIGGNGGSGLFRTQIAANPPTDLTGRQDFSTGAPVSAGGPDFKSSISCGTVAKNNDKNFALQIAAGFLFSLIITMTQITVRRRTRKLV